MNPTISDLIDRWGPVPILQTLEAHVRSDAQAAGENGYAGLKTDLSAIADLVGATSRLYSTLEEIAEATR